MDDNKLRFGVGVLVIAAIGVGIILTFLFGAFPRVLTSEYRINAAFSSADGIAPNSPVLFRGVQIGRVISVELKEKSVLLVLGIETEHQKRLTHEYIPVIQSKSLITSDSVLSFEKGDEEELQKLETRLGLTRSDLQKKPYTDDQWIRYGKPKSDPLSLLYDLEDNFVNTLNSIQSAGESLDGAGSSVDALAMDARQAIGGAGNELDEVAEEAKKALEEFQGAMNDIRSLLNNPEMQANLEGAIAQLPDVLAEAQKTLERFDKVGANFEKVGEAAERTVNNVDQTVNTIRDTVQSAKGAVQSAEKTIKNIERISEPVAANADEIVADLMSNLDNFNATLIEARRFGAALNNSDGTIKRLLEDDEMYWQAKRIVENIENATARIRPILDDVRIFSDKIARDPRELGVRGALTKRPSMMGLK